MLTGHVPFDGESTGEILMKHLSEQPDVSQLPPRIQPVITKSLEKDPAKRYSSIQAFHTAFENAVIGKADPIDIPIENFEDIAATPEDLTSEEPEAQESSSSEPARELKPNSKWCLRDRLMPTTAGWWFIAAVATLTSLITTHGGDQETVPYFMMSALASYIFYSIPRWGGSAVLFDNQPDGRQLEPQQYLRPGWLGAGWLAGAAIFGVSQMRLELPAALLMAYSVFILWRLARLSWKPLLGMSGFPASGKPTMQVGSQPVAVTSPPVSRRVRIDLLSARNRTDQWFTGAALAVVMTVVVTTAIGLVSPSMLQVSSGTDVAPAVVALFSLTTLTAGWLLQLVGKVFEPRHWEDTIRRFALIAVGCLTGVVAWGVGDFLQIDLQTLFAAQEVDAAFDSLGERRLVEGRAPTLLGYITFFAGLFGLRAWWRQTALGRSARFSIGSVLMTVIVAWIWSAVMAFPQTWALVWAAAISAVVQLSSPWSQILGRTRQQNL